MTSRHFRIGIALASWALFLAASPASQAVPVYALTVNNHLLNFDSATPGTTSDLTVTGLQAGEDLIGIDFRPANGLLYALSNSRLYTVNTATGAATLATPLVFSLPSAIGYGMDFNPTVDRLRVVTSGQTNLRINPDTGAITVDTPLTYAVGDPHAAVPPGISAVAYTNNFSGALTTTLYDIDIELNQLSIQNPPNAGILNSVGPGLGIVSNSVERAGFDIATDSGGVNSAFASLSTQNNPNGFYSVNLGSGAVSFIGGIGTFRLSGDVEDIAIAPAGAPPGGGGNVPLPPAALLALPAAAVAAYKARRMKA